MCNHLPALIHSGSVVLPAGHACLIPGNSWEVNSLIQLMMLVCEMPAEDSDNQATKAQFAWSASQWNDSLSEDHCESFVHDVS